MKAAMKSKAVQKPTEENEIYFTPIPVVMPFLERIFPHGLAHMTVMEPCVGTGEIVEACLRAGASRVICGDVNEELIEYARKRFAYEIKCGRVEIHKRDFAEWNQHADLVITNPPFSLAQKVAEHFLRKYWHPHIALLLRQAFLESTGRASLHQEFPCNFYIMDRRIQFYVLRDGKVVPKLGKDGKNGCDQWAYSWFHWSKGPGGHWSTLHIPTSAETRAVINNPAQVGLPAGGKRR